MTNKRVTRRTVYHIAEQTSQAFHPAYTLYEVPPDPLHSSPRRPRASHSAQPAPVSYALLREKDFFVLKRSLNDPRRDNIVIGKLYIYKYIYIYIYLKRSL
jgi:hypothetical protein